MKNEKVLRVGIVYRDVSSGVGEVLDDVIFPPRVTVSVGYLDEGCATDYEKVLLSNRCRHVALRKAALQRINTPRRYEWFRYEAVESRYYLRIPAFASAKVRTGDAPVQDVDGPKLWPHQAKLPLDTTSQGAIYFANVTLLFQFVDQPFSRVA